MHSYVINVHVGPSGNAAPSERQLLDAYYAEVQRLIDAPDFNPLSVLAYIDPVIQQNFIQAYRQSVVSDDRTRMLNYAKTVSCLRLISTVEVRHSSSETATIVHVT